MTAHFIPALDFVGYPGGVKTAFKIGEGRNVSKAWLSESRAVDKGLGTVKAKAKETAPDAE